MLNLSKFLETKEGRLVMSILLGFGLASVFKMSCKGKNCIVYESPNLDEFTNDIYGFNNKCYKYKTKQTICNNKKQIINFA
jgi:hypothetical protein